MEEEKSARVVPPSQNNQDKYYNSCNSTIETISGTPGVSKDAPAFTAPMYLQNPELFLNGQWVYFKAVTNVNSPITESCRLRGSTSF